MKKIITYILLSATLFSIGNISFFIPVANATSNTWDFSVPGDYTLSNINTTEVSSGIAQLKEVFVHVGKKKDTPDLNSANDVVVDGNYAYLTSSANDKLTILDISIPAVPVIVGTLLHNGTTALLDGAAGIVKDGNYVYIASRVSDAVQIIDVSNPAIPLAVAQITNTPGSNRLNGARGIVKSGNYLYVSAQSSHSVTVIDVTTPTAPVWIMGLRDTTRLRSTRDLTVLGNYIYATSYSRDRITSIDISTPTVPVIVDSITDTRLNGAWQVTASGGNAYVSSNLDNSVQVIDISNPASLSITASINTGGDFLLTQPRDLTVEGDTLFVTANSSDAINAIDISTPASPTFIASMVHVGGPQELNGARGIFELGGRIYVAAGASDALEILDFQYDTNSPTVIPTTAFSYAGEDLNGFSEITGAGHTGDITYQISKDNGVTWYYWNGSAWQTTINGVIDSISASIVNTNIAAFDSLAGGTDQFLWKAFLTSNGTQKVEIDSISASSLSVNPVLTITKTDNDADNTVTTDQVVRYTITLSNTGIDATGISITDTIDSDYGSPYNFTYSSCGTPSQSFIDPTLTFSSVSVTGGSSCLITYDLQVDSGASGGSTITNSADSSAAVEGGNDPATVTADTLTILACGMNDVSLVFETDDYGEDTFWSLVPNGNACGVGEISNGGNPNLDCSMGGAPGTAGAGDPYTDGSIITEGPLSLTVGNQYDLHVIDDYGDGISVGASGTDPDVRIQQNGGDTDTFSVAGNGGVFTFTVVEPTGCADITNPDVSVNQGSSQADPTAVDSATFKVVFDEAINVGTFIASDISLSGTTGTVTTGPTEVSPNNGTSFEFIVTGMTSSNTVTATINAGNVQDIAGNTNNASTSIDNQVTYSGGDVTPPTISSTNFASGSLLPGGSHSIIINYTDSESGVDGASPSITLHKWDGASWGVDTSGVDITTVSTGTGSSHYSSNDLSFGKYQYRFSISDNDGNTTMHNVDFYIDQPEFLISTESVDIGVVDDVSNSFSPEITIIVKTVGAGFDVLLNKNTTLTYSSETIADWNGSIGFGYDQDAYTGNISLIGVDENIGTQAASINTNGNLNTYIYKVKMGAIIDSMQAGGDYSGSIDFSVNLDY